MAASKELHVHVEHIVSSLNLPYHIKSCDVHPFSTAITASLLAIDLHEELPDGKHKVRHFIAKVKQESDEATYNWLALDMQYFNECKVYSEVIPLFLKMVPQRCNLPDIFPECLHSSYTKLDPIVIIDNLAVKGFKMTSFEAMDFEHCVLSLKALALLHSYSYAMKRKDPSTFNKHIVKDLQDPRYSQNSGTFRFLEQLTSVNGKECIRSFKELYPEDSKLYEELLEKLLKIFSESTGELYRTLVKAEEPFAVLCHGDFNRNNIMFRYNEGGKPCEVKLIDFQTVRYASPAIDISLLLFLNTTSEFRADNEDALLNIYHQTMLETTAQLLGCKEKELKSDLSLNKFKVDYVNHAIYGFLISIMFTRSLFATDEEHDVMWEVFDIGRCTDEGIQTLFPIGGKFIEKRLCDMLRDMLVRGYLNA